jgi:hypothetical protein
MQTEMGDNFRFLFIWSIFEEQVAFDQEAALGELYQKERSERDWRFSFADLGA